MNPRLVKFTGHRFLFSHLEEAVHRSHLTHSVQSLLRHIKDLFVKRYYLLAVPPEHGIQSYGGLLFTSDSFQGS
jgi:hypothetical protein